MTDLLLSLLLNTDVPTLNVSPAVISDPVKHDADDPAIWVNKAQPQNSIIFGTDKIAKVGAIVAYNLDGKIVQVVDGLDRPNNIDVEYGFDGGDEWFDIAVATERKMKRLLVYKIDSKSGRIADITGQTAIYAPDHDEPGEPMGIGLYKHGNRISAFVSRHEGPQNGYLLELGLTYNRLTQKIDVASRRFLGEFSGKKEIESIFVDDKNAVLYYSDELFGVRAVDLSAKDPTPLGVFRTANFTGDHEGLAAYQPSNGPSYLLSTDQIKGQSYYYLYALNAKQIVAEDRPLFRIAGADDTDGIDATCQSLGPKFPQGILVTMNSSGKNFFIYDWREIAAKMKGISTTRQ